MSSPAPSVPGPAQDSLPGYEEATAEVRRHAGQVRLRAHTPERASLAGVGRVLAHAILADRDQPPFPRSTRDGFACRAADLATGPVTITGLVRAGQSAGCLAPGAAVEIMTGAPVPFGADCVVMIEHVTVAGHQLHLTEGRSLAPGENIVPAGAEALAGNTIVPAGRRLGPADIAAAAACGVAEVLVIPRPRVAILATGDELVPVATAPLPYQIRNSNSYSLAAQVAANGGIAEIFPIVPDNADATRLTIAQAASSDLILLTGGVSMGKFDFVEQALLALGAEFVFTGARIQPGKPVVFGRLPVPAPYFFGLPGNPISTIVTFTLFAGPFLRALGGETDAAPRFVLARLQEEVRVRPGLTRFLPARLESDLCGAQVRRIPWQGSGDLAAAARANAFLVVPESASTLAAGEIVSVLLL